MHVLLMRVPWRIMPGSVNCAHRKYFMEFEMSKTMVTCQDSGTVRLNSDPLLLAAAAAAAAATAAAGCCCCC